MSETKQEKKERQYREELLEGIPTINLAALFMPPIWGPAQGIWITILFYPLWLFADNVLYGAYSNPTPLTIILAVIVAVAMAAFTIFFAKVSQPYALERALAKGISKEKYLKQQRIWAVAMAIVAILMIAFATYYNLVIRPTLGA